jgi:hypothetical protein
LFHHFKSLIFAASVLTFGAASASATIAVQAYTFTGDCTDCTGSGTATLILLDGYILGTPLSAADLVSFNYTSNLIPDLSIHNDPTETLSGVLPVGLGAADISISGMNGSFSSSTDGAWSAFDPPADFGTGGTWTTAGAVATPEPSMLYLTSIGLLVTIFFTRQKMKA